MCVHHLFGDYHDVLEYLVKIREELMRALTSMSVERRLIFCSSRVISDAFLIHETIS